MEYWRLDTVDGDFFLVSAPNLQESSLIRAYHVELLARVRNLPHHDHVESDEVIFGHLKNYYEKISAYLCPIFDASLLAPQSRHTFFIASTQQNEFWLSGLEQLMGYSFESQQNINKIQISTGKTDLDLIAELLLLCPSANLDWLTKKFSMMQIAQIIKQISQRQRGQEAIDELQREIDFRTFEEQGKEALVMAGFVFPEVAHE